MDNCCCYTSTNSCLSVFRNAVLLDSALFLIKIGAAIYFLVVGIENKIKTSEKDNFPHHHPHHYASSVTIGLYLAGGCILLLLIILRLIFNRVLYNDANNPENVKSRSSCCNTFWYVISGASLAFSCAVVATTTIPLIIRLTAWVSIVLEPIMFLIVVMFRRFVRQRFNLSNADNDSNYN